MHEQHLLLCLVLLLLLRLLMQFHVGVPAVAGLDTVSAILCAACLVPAHLNCNCCRFLLWVSFGLWSMSSICCSVCCSFCCRLAVSVERLLMQFHLEVPALPILHAVSAILCAACLVPVHLNCSWCRFLLWVSLGPWGMSSICCFFCWCFC